MGDNGSKRDTTKYASLLISLVAIGFSLFSFYYQSVRIKHDFRGSLYFVSPEDQAHEPAVNGEFLIENRGNQVEVLRELRFLFAFDSACDDNFSSEEHLGPAIFKPTESSVLRLVIPKKSIEGRLPLFRSTARAKKGEDARLFICGYFNVIDSNGSPSAKLYRFGSLVIKPDDTLDGPFGDPSEESGLVDLLSLDSSTAPRKGKASGTPAQ